MSIGRMAVPKRLQAATQVSEADPAVTRRVSWIEERSLANRDSDMSTGHLDASDYGTQETPEPAPKTREPLAKLAPSTCQTGTPLKEKVLKESLYPSLPQAISIGTTVGTTMQTGRTGSPAPIRPVTPIRASQPALPLVRGTGQATPGQAKPRRVRTNDMIWREAHVDVFPGLPIRPMPAASRAILAQMQERMTKQGVDWATYFDWCIRNWRHVTATQFGWMNKSPPPMFPDLRFFLTAKLHEGFADAYARRQERERLDMTGGEAGVYARALAAGQTHDQALLEIGKQRAAAAAHGDLDKTRKHLERSLAALEQDRRALRKPAMVVPPAPPPPGPGEHVRLGGPVAPLQEPTQEMLDCLHTDHVFLAWDAE